MEFEPIEHAICSIANKRKTTVNELASITKEDTKTIISLIGLGISKNIIKVINEKSEKYYTLTPFGEKQLEIMSSKIMDGWNSVIKAINAKDLETFVKIVGENKEWVKYLRYTRMVPTEDADFILETYEKINKSKRKKKKTNLDVQKLQTDAEIKRTQALTEQQWKFDDQNYEITRDHNEYVDLNYYDNNNSNY